MKKLGSFSFNHAAAVKKLGSFSFNHAASVKKLDAFSFNHAAAMKKLGASMACLDGRAPDSRQRCRACPLAPTQCAGASAMHALQCSSPAPPNALSAGRCSARN
ncbi:MAG: hypothetical protein U1F26_14215 [Lysobacterales bacterium]